MRQLAVLLCLSLAVLLFSAGEAWSLPKCPGSYSPSTWTNCVGAITDSYGTKAEAEYVGEWREGKKHGQGTFTYKVGTTYVGEFRDNEFHGQGTLTFAATDDLFNPKTFILQRKYVGKLGGKYIGEWDEGFWHGQGSLTLSDGSSYVGEFTDNAFHGQGTYTHASGSVLKGVWEWHEFVSQSKP